MPTLSTASAMASLSKAVPGSMNRVKPCRSSPDRTRSLPAWSHPLARSWWRDDEGLPGLRPAGHGRSVDVKRILLAGLYHETNTFVTETTGLDRFSTRHGADLLACAGDGS